MILQRESKYLNCVLVQVILSKHKLMQFGNIFYQLSNYIVVEIPCHLTVIRN